MADREQVRVTMFCRDKSIFVNLLAAAKAKYLEASQGRLSIKAVEESSRDQSWREIALRHPRRATSVITEDGGTCQITGRHLRDGI
jgi:hypothetical protein